MNQSPVNIFSPQSDFEQAARRLSREEFVAQYPDPILWVVPPPGTTGKITASADPIDPVESYRRTILQDDEVEADPAAAAAYLGLAAPVRKRPNNPFPHMISVGRAGNNDVVVPLGTISKLHAYFLKSLSGEGWSLTDWTSTNGTTLAGTRIEARETVPLESGTCLSFGKELWAHFYLPADFHEAVQSGKPLGELETA